MNSANNLTRHFLIATPQIKNSVFAGTLIYIIDHDDEGSSGIIVNRPLDVSFDKLFSVASNASTHASNKLSLDSQALKKLTHKDAQNPDNKALSQNSSHAIYFGGPLASDRGFVLHSLSDKPWEGTIVVDSDIALTTSKDIIDDIINNNGPEKSLIALGYAGWQAQQLEKEMLDNDWIAVPASSAILFDVSFEKRLAAASKDLGIDMNLLMPQSGHA